MALYTVRAAAEQLGVAYSTLKRWVHTGHVRTSRTEGGHHRISDNEIDRLLARQQPEGRRRRAIPDRDESLDGLSARTACTGSSMKCALTACLHRSACASVICR